MCENRRRAVPAGDREGDNGMTDVPTSAEAMGILDMVVEERSIHPEDYRWPVTEFQEVVEDLRPRGDVFGESLIRIVEEDLSPGEDYGETLTWTSSPYWKSRDLDHRTLRPSLSLCQVVENLEPI